MTEDERISAFIKEVNALSERYQVALVADINEERVATKSGSRLELTATIKAVALQK